MMLKIGRYLRVEDVEQSDVAIRLGKSCIRVTSPKFEIFPKSSFTIKTVEGMVFKFVSEPNANQAGKAKVTISKCSDGSGILPLVQTESAAFLMNFINRNFWVVIIRDNNTARHSLSILDLKKGEVILEIRDEEICSSIAEVFDFQHDLLIYKMKNPFGNHMKGVYSIAITNLRSLEKIAQKHIPDFTSYFFNKGCIHWGINKAQFVQEQSLILLKSNPMTGEDFHSILKVGGEIPKNAMIRVSLLEDYFVKFYYCR